MSQGDLMYFIIFGLALVAAISGFVAPPRQTESGRVRASAINAHGRGNLPARLRFLAERWGRGQERWGEVS